MPRSKPPYPAEFRQQIVQLVRAGRTPAELAKEFGCSGQAIRNWVAQDAIDQGKPAPGKEGALTTVEREELVRLRHRYLTRQLQALIARTHMLEGATITFDQESEALYDAVAPRHHETQFAVVLSRLELRGSLFALVFVYVAQTVPVTLYMLRNYFDTIPVELDEAGMIDGLTPFGTFWRLILPLARPGLAVAAFYAFITAFAEVAFASTFLLDDSKYTFAVGLQSFISEHDAQWNLMAATAVLIAIPVTVFFYLVQRHVVTGLTAGGVKG